MTDLDIIDAEVVEDALSYGDALDGMNALASDARDINERIARYTERAAFLWSHRAWEVLGHKTWAECVEERGAQLRLPRADRRELVALLDQKGMTTRAIAPVVGANYATVSRDLASPVANATPATAPRTKTGLDGKTYTVQPVKVSFDTFTAPSVRAGHLDAGVKNFTPDHRSPRAGCTTRNYYE